MCRFTQRNRGCPLSRRTLPDGNSVSFFCISRITDDYIIGPFTGRSFTKNNAVIAAFPGITDSNGIIVQFTVILGFAETEAMILAVVSKFSIIE